MHYVYDRTTRRVLGGVTWAKDLAEFISNWPAEQVSSAESSNRIPSRSQGYWIINEQLELENILD